jgi:hypothetical protein
MVFTGISQPIYNMVKDNRHELDIMGGHLNIMVLTFSIPAGSFFNRRCVVDKSGRNTEYEQF